MSELKTRLNKLENLPAAKEPVEIRVNLIEGDFIIDQDTGEKHTKQEYYEMHKDDPNYIFVGWNDQEP